MSKMKFKKDLVQLQNPRSGMYVKVDRGRGQIVSQKNSSGPYKGVDIVSRKSTIGHEDWSV